MTHADVERWITAYEVAWRTEGTASLAALFTPDATYRAGPFEEPVRGLPAIAEFWESEREGHDEAFTMASRIVAVDGDVGVARIEVDYGTGERWLDLWILTLGRDGRCSAFEEWFFAPPA